MPLAGSFFTGGSGENTDAIFKGQAVRFFTQPNIVVLRHTRCVTRALSKLKINK